MEKSEPWGPREPGGGHIPEIKLLSHALPASFPRGVAASSKAMVEGYTLRKVCTVQRLSS
jgi:hypothetical protein